MDQLIIDDQILDVDDSAMRYIKQQYRYEALLTIAIAIVWELLILFIWRGTTHLNESAELLIFLLALPVIILGFIVSALKESFRHKFYEQFAKTNNFTYTKTADLENQLGTIFQVGHSTKNEDIIEGEVNNLPVRLFNYQYTVKHGKSSTKYNKTIFEVDLQTSVPPLLLLVDTHLFGDNLSDNNISHTSKISLTPDLEQHFSLFTEKKFEIEALQIFTPEFLQLIYTKYKFFSIDFVGTKLYIYANHIITKKTELELMMEFLSLICQRLANKLPQMRGSIIALTESLSKTSSPTQLFKKESITNIIIIIFCILFLVPIIVMFIKGILQKG